VKLLRIEEADARDAFGSEAKADGDATFVDASKSEDGNSGGVYSLGEIAQA
jgi:hypothetical protein